MKIAIINTLYYPNVVGGAERSVQFLAEALVNKGHEVVVICTAPEQGIQTERLNGVKVYYLGLKNIYWQFSDKNQPSALKLIWHGLDTYNPMMAKVVGSILKAEHPDIVHTNNLGGFSVAVWRVIKKYGFPLIHTLRDHYLLCPPSTMFKGQKNCEHQCVKCRLYAFPRQRATQQVDSVVGISRFILNRHLAFGSFKTVTRHQVIFNAYDVIYNPNQPSVVAYSKLDRVNRPLKLGYLGRLHPIKGLELLLDTVTRNFSENECEIWIAGKGEQRYDNQLKNSFNSSIVYFMGHVEPAELFNKIDILVVPSLCHEAFGRIIIEAYAHGVPVIGSNRGGIPEIIESGKTGFVFEPNDMDSLITKIKYFVDDPHLVEKMRPAVLEKAKEFLPERIVNQYITVYQQILALT